MAFSDMLRQHVEIDLRVPSTVPAAEDRYGVPDDVVTTIETVGYMEQRGRSEPDAEGQVQEERMRLFLLPSISIDGWATVRVDGVTYDVVGEPWQVHNPRVGFVHHVECDLERAR